jgi:hypothetical protein
MPKPLPSPELLRKLLRYEPETGKLFWLSRTLDIVPNERNMNSFNSQFAGKEAFIADNGEGYRKGGIFRRTYKAHRVIFAIAYGRWPTHEIDHINGNKADNRLCNLREATRSQNQRNRKPRGGASKYKGVYKKGNYWASAICFNGAQLHLGTFKNELDAYAAYCAASKKHHGEYGRIA